MFSSHEGRAVSRARQLELWSAADDAQPSTGLCVLRRDGRESAFDVETLSKSILRAGWPSEALDGDTALSLSRAVGLYLQHSSRAPVPVETLRQTVERLLLDMGYALTARMYAGTFAPGPHHTLDGAAGMFEEALPLDRAERTLAALAADAGLDHAAAEDLLATVFRQIHAAKVYRLTPGLLREWLGSELQARGLSAEAARIARISLPASALHDVFAGNVRAHAAPPADPESAALALAARVSAAYVIGQLMPSRTGQAHLRGEIHIRGAGDFVRLDSLEIDLEGLKDRGVLSPASTGFPSPITSPESLATQLAAQNEIFGRYFGGQIVWTAINFGFAPLLDGRTDRDLTEVARGLLSAANLYSARTASVEYRIAWDAPDFYPREVVGARGERIPLEETYPNARRMFGAALDLLCELAHQGIGHSTPRIAIHLSPYFFGAPESARCLEQLGRIAVSPLPITLRYEAAAPMMFDDGENSGRAHATAQTVCIPVARAAKLASGINAFLARIDAALDSAVAAHREKHSFLDRLSRERSGPLALLSRRYGPGPFAAPASMQYRIAVSESGVSELSRAGIPWILPGEEASVAEAALLRLREACVRWTSATGLQLTLADAEATRRNPRADVRPPHVTRPTEAVAREGALHPLYDHPPSFALSGEDFASPGDAAAFIEHAFLHTPCRALFFA